jgi:transposase InsO family protein
MSRKGNPYDNAFAESFIKTLKYEEVLPLQVVSYLITDKFDANVKKHVEEEELRI